MNVNFILALIAFFNLALFVSYAIVDRYFEAKEDKEKAERKALQAYYAKLMGEENNENL